MDLDTLRFRLGRSEALPALPEVALEVMRLSRENEVSPRGLQVVIEKDAAITAKLLRVASSPAFAGTDITNVGRAIAFLGVGTTRSIVTTAAFQKVLTITHCTSRFNLGLYWQHSLATAIAAGLIARVKQDPKWDDYYCAGLLHDIGLLVLAKFCGDDLSQAIGNAEMLGIGLYATEREVIGFDHAVVGDMVGEVWNLPSMVRAVVKNIEDPAADLDWVSEVGLVAAADAVAFELGFGNHCAKPAIVLEDAWPALELPEGQLEIMLPVLQTEIEKQCATFKVEDAAAAA